MSSNAGFTLIEAIATLLILSIVAAFGGMLLGEGARGFATANTNAETALTAQIALDRIALEIKEADAITSVTPTSVTYVNPDIAAAPRSISLVGQDLVISQGADSNPLLRGVTDLAIGSTSANLDNNAANGNEIESISVRFARGGAQFRTQIYPRAMLPHP